MKEQARNKYRELSEEEKGIKRRYGRNRYKNISEEKYKDRMSSKKIMII